MNARQFMLSSHWVDDVKSFGEIIVHKPHAHRLDALIAKGNVLFAREKGRDQTDLNAIAECMFVFSRTRDELKALKKATDEEWNEAVDEFFADLSDDQLSDFSNYFKETIKSMEAAIAEPEGKPES